MDSGLGLAACQSEATPTPTVDLVSTEDLSPEQVITLGDIDPDEPTKKLKRFQPLATYLAEHLTEFGIKAGHVVIARDIREMGRFLKDGSVDVYFDSPYPTLTVQELSGSRVILRRWKQNDPTYWGTYVALRNSGISSVEDFVGKVVAFEEPFSTSGFVLPAGTLIQRGLILTEVDGPDVRVPSDEINYFFSGDEENTFELIMQGRIAGGGVSNQDYEVLPAAVKEQIIAFDRTISVPRQLVSAGAGLDLPLVDRVRELLIGLNQSEEGQLLLEDLKRTKKFDPLPPDSEAALQEFKGIMRLITKGQ